MPNIIFPYQDIPPDNLPASSPQFGALAPFNALDCSKLQANMPYCTCSHPSGRSITQLLSSLPPQSRQNLLRTVDNFGDQTTALAEIYDRHFLNLELQPLVGVAGATTSAFDNRLSALQKAMLQYQETLIQLNRHKGVGRVESARKAELKTQARTRFAALQNQFALELKRLTPANHASKNRGSALVSAERGLILADRRRSRQLFITDGNQANKLNRFAKSARYAGNGMVALDAGFRAHDVHRTYETGGDWQRQAAIEATGLGLGTAVGIGVGKAAVTGLIAIGLGATPVGWVVLIAVGAGAGFAAANLFDRAGKGFAAGVWDRTWN